MLSHWTVRTGNSKAVDSVHVDHDDSWLGLLTTLRQIEKDGDRGRKQCHKIYADVVYRTFDRQKTPPPGAMEVNGRARGKAKPHTMRVTRLTSPAIDNSSDQEIDDTQPDDDDDLELPPYLPSNSRDSTTNQQFRQKKAREVNRPAPEYIRQKISVVIFARTPTAQPWFMLLREKLVKRPPRSDIKAIEQMGCFSWCESLHR
jgi:hypothetical protein